LIWLSRRYSIAGIFASARINPLPLDTPFNTIVFRDSLVVSCREYNRLI
jgi:hypothetical protein